MVAAKLAFSLSLLVLGSFLGSWSPPGVAASSQGSSLPDDVRRRRYARTHATRERIPTPSNTHILEIPNPGPDASSADSSMVSAEAAVDVAVTGSEHSHPPNWAD